jgi:hypothetical protein
MIRFACPNCQKPLHAPEERAGSAVKCPGCTVTVRIPDAAPAPATADDPLTQLSAPSHGAATPDDRYTPPEQVNVPASIAQEVVTLGPVVRVYGTNFFTLYSMVAYGFFAVALVVVVVVLIATARVGEKALPVLAMPCTFSVVAVLFLLPLLLKGWQRVILYERGFAFIRWSTGQVIRWEDIAETWRQTEIREHRGQHGGRIGTSYHYRLTLSMRDGTSLTFDNHLKDIKLFGVRVASEVEKAGGQNIGEW